jgi:hypothetical protein
MESITDAQTRFGTDAPRSRDDLMRQEVRNGPTADDPLVLCHLRKARKELDLDAPIREAPAKPETGTDSPGTRVRFQADAIA